MKKQIISLLKVQHVRNFLKRKRVLSTISIVLIFACLNLTAGCVMAFKVNSHTNADGELPAKLEDFKEENKYFILLVDGVAWQLKNITISEDNTELFGSIKTLPANRHKFIGLKAEKLYGYWLSGARVLKEAHIYVSEYSKLDGVNVVIPFSGIEKIDVFNFATGAYIGGNLLLAGGVIVIGALGIYLLMAMWAASY